MAEKKLFFNDKEFMLLYMAVGSCYSEIKEFTISDEFDTTDLEVQEMALHNEIEMEKLYEKMRGHVVGMYPFADVLFKRDTQKPRPNKHAQFQGNNNKNGTS